MRWRTASAGSMGASVAARAWAAIGAVAVILVAAPSTADDETFERSIVRVNVAREAGTNQWQLGHGTGFAINDRGDIVTNWHVVVDQVGIFVLAEGQRSDPRQGFDFQNKFAGANVERNPWSSRELDLAVIRVKPEQRAALGLRPVVLTNQIPRQGARVRVQGYPGVADRVLQDTEDILASSTFTSGELARIADDGKWHRETVRQLLHTAPINGGNSGGPLFDDCGRVIGINTAVPQEVAQVLDARTGKPTAGVTLTTSSGYAIATNVNELIEILDSQHIPYTLDESPCAPGATVAFAPPSWMLYGGGGLLVVIALGLLLVMRRSGGEASAPPPFPVQPLPATGTAAGLTGRPAPPAARSTRVATATSARPDLVLEPEPSGSRRQRLVISGDALANGEVVVGRSPGRAELRIDDDSVSRLHCAFFSRGARCFIRDQKSMNGTRVNGRALVGSEEAELAKGASVTIGSVEFRVSSL